MFILARISLILLDWWVDGVPELLIAALDGGGARHRGAEHRHPLVVTALAQGWAHQPPCKPLSGPAHKCPRQGPQRAGCGSPTLAPWAPSLASPPSTLSCQKCDLMCHIENQHHEVDFQNKSTNKKRFFVWRSSKWEKIWEKLTLYWTKWKRIGSQCYAGCNLSGTKAALWGFLSLRTSSTLLALLTGHGAVFLRLRCMLVPSNFSSKSNLNFSPMKAALRCFVSEVITQRQHVLARMQLQWIGTEISKKHFWSISVICRELSFHIICRLVLGLIGWAKNWSSCSGSGSGWQVQSTHSHQIAIL